MNRLTNSLHGALAYVSNRREHFWNFSSSVGLKLIVFVLYFLAVPVLIGSQGPETYGIIAFMIALLGYSSLIDHGLTYTVQLRYVQALSTGVDAPERVVRVAVPIYALVSLIVLITLAPSGSILSNIVWRTDAYAYTAPIIALLLALQVAGSLPMTVLLAHNRVALANLGRLAADALRVVGLLAAAVTDDPVTVALGFFVVGSAAKLAIDLFNCHRTVGLRPILPAWSVREAGAIFRTAWVMWIVAGMSLVVLLYDKWFVTANISPADFATYSIASDLTTRIYFVFYALSGSVYTPLMRKYATKQSTAGLYLFYGAIMLLVALFYYVPLCIWSYEVLNWYVGRDVASAGADIIRIMSAGAVLYLLFNLIEVNMYARGFALRVVPAYAVGVGVIVSLAPQLEAVLGLAGVATSLLLMQAAMFVVLATTFVFIRRAGKRSQPIPQVLP
jgi:O-antigen/teichoic acid export membrane protein